MMTSPGKQSSWGQHGAHLGPVGPRWAPCWPHEPYYQGYVPWWPPSISSPLADTIQEWMTAYILSIILAVTVEGSCQNLVTMADHHIHVVLPVIGFELHKYFLCQFTDQRCSTVLWSCPLTLWTLNCTTRAWITYQSPVIYTTSKLIIIDLGKRLVLLFITMPWPKVKLNFW